MVNRIKSVIGVAILVGTSIPGAAQTPVSAGKGAGQQPPSATATLRPSHGNLSPVIRGNAVTSSNEAMGNRMVRLRDARSGRVVDTQLTDNEGSFSFNTIDPGSYVVELLNNEQHVVAASDIISVNAGDAITTLVRMPFRNVPLAGMLGQTSSSAVLVAAQAAAAGVLAVAVVGSPVSQTQPF